MSFNKAEGHSDMSIICHRGKMVARQNTTIATALVVVSCIFHSAMRYFALPFRMSELRPAIRFYQHPPIETDGTSEKIIIIISERLVITSGKKLIPKGFIPIGRSYSFRNSYHCVPVNARYSIVNVG